MSWKGESMWMPRVSGAYTLGERTVIKGGYGLFYDTLNAGDYTGFNQLGYSSATTNVSSTDFGRSWLLGDPVNGVSPLVDPFPVRVGGGRFEEPIEDALGVDAILGTSFTREDPNRRHPRVQRWRIGVQREVLRNLAVEVAYTGSYADRVGRNIDEVVRARAVLQQRDQRPRRDASSRCCSSRCRIRSTSPTSPRWRRPTRRCITRMAGNSFFTAATVQRQNLLRGYPQLSGLTYANLPLGVVKDHALEITRHPPLFGRPQRQRWRSRRAGSRRTGPSKPTTVSRRCGRRARTRGRGVSAAAPSTNCRSARPSRS